jgi:cytochrome c oxidase subunit IV
MAEHVSSRKIYFLVFGALLVLTYLTWQVAQFDLGPLNDVVALAVAVTKAALVILFFMHVAHSTRLTKLTVVASFFWLLILIGITLTDYLTRPAVDAFRGVPEASPEQELRKRSPEGEPAGPAAGAPQQESPPAGSEAHRQ